MKPLTTSVVLATWNGARHIQQQLHSLATQSRLPNELIVCDDGSSDDTIRIVQAFAADAPFTIRVHINSTNLGLHQNFAKALSLGSGDVLFPCDQDDVWHADKLARFVEHFEKDPQVGLVFGDANVVNADLSGRGYTAWDTVHFTPEIQTRVQNGEAFDVLLRHCFVAGALLGVRSALKELILPIPTSWPYDAWIAMLGAATSTTRLVQAPVNDYRQHGDQSIGTRRKGLLTRYKEARGVTIQYYETMATAHRDLRNRLLEREALMPTDERIFKLDRKIRFAEARVLMRRSLWGRAPLIARQWWAGNYTLFGQGIRSLAMDLLV